MARMISINKTKTDALGNGTGIKLSKLILVNNLESYPLFENLYSIDDDRLSRIVENMKEKGFDGSQPVNIWHKMENDGSEHFYLLDGYTRKKAAILAGLEAIPYYEHTEFKDESEALRYALHLQVDRRSLEPIDLLNNIKKLMGDDYIKSYKGNKNSEIGRLLGISEKTVERNKYVIENATEEQLEQIENKEISAKQLAGNIKKQKFVEENADEEQLNQIKKNEATYEEVYDTLKKTDHISEFDDDGLSDALEDTSGDPHGLSITDHSDGIERPSYKVHPEDDTDRWIKEKNIQAESARKEGLEEGLKKGSDLAYEIYEYILSGIEGGKTADDLRNDEKFSDFSAWKIYKAFGISDNNESTATEPQREEI